jgi:hypothetical protein
MKKFVTCSALFVLSGCQTLERGSFGVFERSLNTKAHGYVVIEDFTGQAPTKHIEKFEVRPGDCSSAIGWSDCENDRERSELMGPKDNFSGSEHWYGWSLYIPNEYINVYPTKTALGQFHQNKGMPAFMFQNYEGGYWIDRNFGITTHKEILISEEELKGRWHHIEVNAKWHKRDGFFIVYVNGEEKWRFVGQTMSEQEVYFKYGVYRSFMSRYKKLNNTDSVPAQTAYFSNVKRARSRDGLKPQEK